MLLPGRPQSTPQALCTGEWQRKCIIAYISGTSIIIFGGVDKLIQTIYLEHRLGAIAFDENTGKIAVCAEGKVYVFRPNGRAEGYLKVSSIAHGSMAELMSLQRSGHYKRRSPSTPQMAQ
jgi:hypothetical protein